MTSISTSGGRHHLATPVRRPSLLPRSATVVAATVGAVVVLGVQERTPFPAPRPHPDAPTRVVSALEPVVPAPREGRPARVDALPASLPRATGSAIAGAHVAGAASINALDAVSALQQRRGPGSGSLFVP